MFSKGYTFKNQKGNICEVLDIIRKDCGKLHKYSVRCHTCFSDTELWKSGDLLVKPDSVAKGKTPCNCGNRVIWNSRQIDVKIDRACKVRFWEHLYTKRKGNTLNDASVFVMCKSSSDIWEVSVNKLIYDTKRCSPSVGLYRRAMRRSIPIHEKIKRIREMCNYEDSTKITHLPDILDCKGRQYFFEIDCHTCRDNGYDILPSASWTSLSKGIKPCKCGGVGGYDNTKTGSLYVVRWYGFGESFLKFGVTNRSVEKRVRESYNSSELDYRILATYTWEDGKIPVKLESLIKQELTTSVCPKQWLPDGYTETLEDTIENLNYIESLASSTFKIKKEGK